MPIFNALKQLKHLWFVRRLERARVAEAARFRKLNAPVFEQVQRSIVFENEIPHVRGIWAIAMVKNEERLIEDTVVGLLAEGVDHVLIVDNGSSDRTRAILSRLAEHNSVTVGDDPMFAYEQAVKMTYLADLAAAHGATWIVPFDADEHWLSPTGRLKEALDAATTPIVEAYIHNLFPPEEYEGGAWRVDSHKHFDPKVAFRPRKGAVLRMGNHGVLMAGKISAGLEIIHTPWVDFEHFAAKLRNGAKAYAESSMKDDAEIGYHWRQLGTLTDDDLHEAWLRILAGHKVEGAAWQPSAPSNLREIAGAHSLSEARAALRDPKLRGELLAS